MIGETNFIHNMVFSLVQQVIRQDPFHYMSCVYARSDGQTRLVSYPSPAVIVRKNENTVTQTEVDTNEYLVKRDLVQDRIRDLVI